jgi:hypothetical protein
LPAPRRVGRWLAPGSLRADDASARKRFPALRRGDFPVAITNLSFLIAYPTSGSVGGFRLASGMASSMHGDAFLAWDNRALGERVKNCAVQRAKCNTAGDF